MSLTDTCIAFLENYGPQTKPMSMCLPTLGEPPGALTVEDGGHLQLEPCHPPPAWTESSTGAAKEGLV